MAQLIHQLKQWQENGLLSESQLSAILAFEESKPKNSWALMGFLTLGVGIVVLGIIAIIAANWMEIPDSVKLFSGFALLIGTAAGIYQVRNHPSALLTDGLKAFFGLSCFAMIGLIAQIYHLKGDGYTTGLLWCAITFMLICDAKNTLTPLFWSFILSISVFAGLLINTWAKNNIAEPCSLFIVLITAAFILVRAGSKNSILAKAMNQLVIFIWILGLSLSSMGWFRSGKFIDGEYLFMNFLPQYVISVFIAVAILLESSLKKMEKRFFVASLVLANLLFSLNYAAQTEYLVLIFLSIACMLSFAFFFLSREQPRLFNFMLILISFKVFEVYVRKYGGLLNTGFGLICTGLVIVGLVTAWMKNRHRIEGRLKEWLL